MADVKVEGPELKKLVKLTKKKPLAFAFCPGKKKEEHVFAIDRRKPPAFLAKNAKRESTGVKVAMGTCELKGKLLSMTCEKAVPTMAKTLKAYLKTQKIMVNIEILDLTGATLESDIEDLPDDPDLMSDDDDDTDFQADDGADQDTDNDDADNDADADADAEELDDAARTKALAARLKAAQPDVMGADGPAGDTLKKVLAAAVSMVKAGDLDKAEDTVTKLENALAKIGAAAPVENDDDNSDAGASGPDAVTLATRAGALKQTIEGVSEPAKGKLLAALGKAAQAIKGGDLTSADAMLARIEAAADKSAAPAPADGSADAAKWAAAEARLQPLVDKAMAEKRGDLDGINRAFNYAKELAADGAYDRALAAAGKVAELLKAAASATTTAAADAAAESIPADVVPYVQSRLSWIDTRTNLRKELEGLKSAIDATTANVEGLEEVPAKSGVLFDYLNEIDTDLEDTLEKLVEAPDGEQREGLKSEARKIIDTYRGVLDQPFFQAVDNNGFVTTNIRGAALDSLQKVSAALAA